MKYRFHHVGIASSDLEQTARLLAALGYLPQETEYDPLQRVDVKFCEHKENPLIELLGGGYEGSPIMNLLAKNGTCPYHLCYEVEDMDRAVEEMRKMGYIPTGTAQRSVICGRKVIFMYHPHNCLIELLDGGIKSEES